MSLSLAEAQRLLDKSNLYKDKIDGIWGPNTERAVNSVLSSHSSWYDEDAVRNNKRKYISAAQILLKIAGYYTDAIDGIAGKNTRSAYDNWYHDVFPVNITPTVKFPCSGTSNLVRFYGPVGKNQTRIDLPFTMKLAWDKSVSISRMTIHEKIASSAIRAFEKIANHYSSEDIVKHGFNLFGGSLNVRKMRGGSSWSTHSWGIAIDFDPERNRLRWNSSRAYLARPECEMFWKIWEEEGWTSLGRWKNYDWMHVQATRRC